MKLHIKNILFEEETSSKLLDEIVILAKWYIDQIQDRCELHVPVFSDNCLVPTSSEDYAQLLLGEQ